MGYVSPDHPDVYLSFLASDNATWPGGTEGWVSGLVRDLKRWLDEAGTYSVFLDDRIAVDTRFSAEGWAGQNAAVVVLVLSREYLGKLWQDPGMAEFRAAIGRRIEAGSRVVLVELDNVAGVRPSLFDGLPNYHFWTEDPVGKQVRTLGIPRTNPLDPAYCARVVALLKDLMEELHRIRPAVGHAPAARRLETALVKTTVYLAQSPNALDDQRLAVRRYLEVEGIRVVPEGPYPRERGAFEAAVRRDMAAASMFVQLLGTHSVAGDSNEDDATKQARRAAEARLQAKIKAEEYDIFLCHNSVDKNFVRSVGIRLKEKGIRPWLDQWDLKPGSRLSSSLHDALSRSRTAAVFLGPAGSGRWQDMEVEALVKSCVEKGKLVIPVVVSEYIGPPTLPHFLSTFTALDFRESDPDPLGQLIWAITGERPAVSVVAEPPAPTDLPESLVVLQHTLALQLGLPVLQWMPLDGPNDPAMRRTLAALPDTLKAYSQRLGEFQTLVLNRVRELERKRNTPSKTHAPPGVGSKLVFVNADPTDETAAERVVEAMLQLGAKVMTAYDGDPFLLTRDDSEEILKQSDAYMVFHGKANGNWVSSQFIRPLRVIHGCEKPPRKVIYQAPPKPKEKIGYRDGELHIIEGEAEPDEESLAAFLQGL